jgi:hypothetical protein
MSKVTFLSLVGGSVSCGLFALIEFNQRLEIIWHHPRVAAFRLSTVIDPLTKTFLYFFELSRCKACQG